MLTVDSLSLVTTPSQETAMVTPSKHKTEVDAEDEEKRHEVKSPNLKTSQVETKEDVLSVSTVRFVLSCALCV